MSSNPASEFPLIPDDPPPLRPEPVQTVASDADSIDLAVVVVTWNSIKDIDTCLRSLLADLASSDLTCRVIVVDGGSTDETAAHVTAAYPQVDVVVSAENIGFGRSNNLGLKHAGFDGPDAPRAAYLLNPDTETHAGATRILFDALMSDQNVGLVGARLSYGDGTFQHSAFRFPGLRQLWAEFFPTPGRFVEGGFNGRYPRRLYDAGEPFAVDFVLGATMMVKREAIARAGMFDPQFFMYCEEVDWAWRIRRAQFEVRCVPAAHVTHFAGQSTRQAKPRTVVNLWTSRIQLFFKYYPAWKVEVAAQMVAAGMKRKLARERDPELRAAYETVRQMALGLK